MSEHNGTAPQIDVPAEQVLPVVIAQRDRALNDLAVAQAACTQLAARIRELEAEQVQAKRPRAATGTG